MKAERCNFGYQHQKICGLSKARGKTELTYPGSRHKGIILRRKEVMTCKKSRLYYGAVPQI